jgi:hypothetical protein
LLVFLTSHINPQAYRTAVAFAQEYSIVLYPLGNVSILSKVQVRSRTPRGEGPRLPASPWIKPGRSVNMATVLYPDGEDYGG